MKESGLILKTLRGSITYGMDISPEVAKAHGLDASDRDEMGVFVPPKSHLYGMFQADTKERGEYVVYPLLKYLKLAAGCNPNILEMLFVEPEHVIYKNDLGQALIDNRHLFLSKRAYRTYSGYAYSQMNKLYARKANTTTRIDLVDRFGYDVKAASHVVRLLLMGIEILEDGHLSVMRPEREMLTAIRLGKFELKEVEDLVEGYMERIYESFVMSNLPERPDMDKISRLSIELHEGFWNTNEREHVQVSMNF